MKIHDLSYNLETAEIREPSDWKEQIFSNFYGKSKNFSRAMALHFHHLCYSHRKWEDILTLLQINTHD